MSDRGGEGRKNMFWAEGRREEMLFKNHEDAQCSQGLNEWVWRGRRGWRGCCRSHTMTDQVLPAQESD